MNVVLLCMFACRSAAFCAVWGGQPKAQSPFLNLKGQPALFVCVGLAAALRVLCPANAVSRFLRLALWVWTSMMRRAELFQCFQTFSRFFEKSRNGWD